MTDENENSSLGGRNNKIRKIKSKLNIENLTCGNISRKRNLFHETFVRTKSIDKNISKILETQNKNIMVSGIFDNINIKKYKTDKNNNKLIKKSHLINNSAIKSNNIIKVNVKMTKSKNPTNINNSKEKSKINKENNKNKEIKGNYKTEKSDYLINDTNLYNFITQENFYSRKINKIILIQKYWKKYLYSHGKIHNTNDYINYIRKTKTRMFLIKVKRIIYSKIFRLLKYKLYNINYYFHLWYNITFLRKILKKIIDKKKKNYRKNIPKIIPNYTQFKNHNSSRRQIRSNFYRFQTLNIFNNNFSKTNNNLSSIDNNYLIPNKINKYIRKTTVQSLTNVNSTRKASLNKSSERTLTKHYLEKVIKKKTKSNVQELFKNNKINLNLVNEIKTPSNKNSFRVIKNKNIFDKKNKKIEIKPNNKTCYLTIDKIEDKNNFIFKNNKNKTVRALSDKHFNFLFPKKRMSKYNINNEISNISPNMTIIGKFMKIDTEYNWSNKNKSINISQKNKKIKDMFYKLQKFDSFPLSLSNKKKSNVFIYKSKNCINNYFIHWKNIIFKGKLVKYLIIISNKIKLRKIFYRTIIRMVMDFFQIIILKKNFDKYKYKPIETNILLKLRAFLLKNNKLKRYIDSSNKENSNYYSLKGGDIINNININNFINYDSNKIIPLDKNYNLWNSCTHVNNFRFPISYIKDNKINVINTKNETRNKQNYKIVKIKNSYPEGIIISQINQLRMVFNLIEQKRQRQNNKNINNYFNIWKTNTLDQSKNKVNFRKINMKQKKEYNRYSKKNTIYSARDSNQNKNNKTIRLIDNINKKKIDSSSELSMIRTQINSEIVYTKKILNHNNNMFKNYYRKNNNILIKGHNLRKINKIEEREVHFNSLSVNKDNPFLKNKANENIIKISDKLTESGIKKKISKIKIEFMENPMMKNRKGKKINCKLIFDKIKNSFDKTFGKIVYKDVNQTFCCISKNYQDDLN